MVLLKAKRLRELAEKLAAIQGQLEREGGELVEVRQRLDAAAARAGVELETVRRLDPATLEMTLSPGDRPDPARFWAVAEILYLDGLRARAKGDGAAASRRLEKARRLFRRAEGRLELPEGAATPHRRLEEIGELLGPGG